MRALGLVLVLLAAGVARADILVLDDGRKIEGEVVRETETEIELKIPHGSTTFPRERVVRIERRPSPEQEFTGRREKLAPDDAAGRVELARFALEKRFPRARVVELAVEAWRIDPDLRDAWDVLRKLDHRFERGEWVAPEKWYPDHGFIRRDGKWLPLEEVALVNAIVATQKGKDELGLAERTIKSTEEAILRSGKAESDAKHRVDQVKDEVAALATKRIAAKADLDTRETDLKIAADKTTAARRDLTIAQSAPCPADPTGKAAWDQRVVWADQQLRNAVLVETEARRKRDAALASHQDLVDQEAKGPARIREAEAALEAVRNNSRVLREELPKLKDRLPAIRDRVAQLEAQERSAKTALEERKIRDARDEAARDEALRTWKKRREESPKK